MSPSTSTVVLALAALASAQTYPTSTVLPMPFFIPFATSIGGSVASVDSSASIATIAVTCLDATCPGPKTGTYVVGASTLNFKWGSDAGWQCPLTAADATCTLSAGGETNTRTDAVSTLLPSSATGGVADPVTISTGWDRVAAVGSGSGSGSMPMSTSMPSASSSGSSSSARMTSSGSTTMATSSAHSSSASASATAGSAGERLVASGGIIGAAALLVGAIVA